MKTTCCLFSIVLVVIVPVLTTSQTLPSSSSRRVATVYDILSLIYRLCVAEGDQRVIGLQCVDYHMGAEVSEILEQCMANHKIRGEELPTANPNATGSPSNTSTTTVATVLATGVDRLCDKLTLVEEWTEKHTRPPHQLTTVIGIEALGRMTCVMGSVQRPLPTWTAAFSKCFFSQDTATAGAKTKGKFLTANDNL